MKKINIEIGTRFGKLVVIKIVGSVLTPNGSVRYYSCKCDCGNIVKATSSGLRRGNNRSCGCLRHRATVSRNFRHGCRYHPLYHTWHNMIARCYYPRYRDYHRYGGRGICVEKDWISDPQKFINYCITLSNWDNQQYGLDRINTNGNYEVGNIRFVDKHTQSSNILKRYHKYNYTGITRERNGKYVGLITIRGKKIRLGVFTHVEDAVKARNNYIIDNNLLEYPTQTIG